MNKTLPALFLSVASLFATAATAAPIIAQDSYAASWATDTGGIGQTFVWPSSSPLTVARVVAAEAAFTGTFKLYSGAHTCDDSGGEFYSQTNIPLALGVFSPIALTAPQALTNGGTYTFCVYNVTGGRLVLNYTAGISFYPGGAYVSDATFDPAGGGGDLQFELDGPAAAIVSAPTLGTGALGASALLLLALGMRTSRRRGHARA